MLRTQYEVLGVAEQATCEEIAVRYYQLFNDNYPPYSESEVRRLSEIREAFFMLCEPEMRADYDRRLELQRAGLAPPLPCDEVVDQDEPHASWPTALSIDSADDDWNYDDDDDLIELDDLDDEYCRDW